MTPAGRGRWCASTLHSPSVPGRRGPGFQPQDSFHGELASPHHPSLVPVKSNFGKHHLHNTVNQNIFVMVKILQCVKTSSSLSLHCLFLVSGEKAMVINIVYILSTVKKIVVVKAIPMYHHFIKRAT